MLPVGQLPDDFNGVPVDGEQYLAMVRREAENQPRVFYSTEYVRCTGEAAVAPASSDAFMPSFEWRALFLTRFGRLQEVRRATYVGCAPSSATPPPDLPTPPGCGRRRRVVPLHSRTCSPICRRTQADAGGGGRECP